MGTTAFGGKNVHVKKQQGIDPNLTSMPT